MAKRCRQNTSERSIKKTPKKFQKERLASIWKEESVRWEIKGMSIILLS